MVCTSILKYGNYTGMSGVFIIYTIYYKMTTKNCYFKKLIAVTKICLLLESFVVNPSNFLKQLENRKRKN